MHKPPSSQRAIEPHDGRHYAQPSVQTAAIMQSEAADHASSARVLPALMNQTIGRVEEVLTLSAWLRRGDLRLLTLTGTGGIGKTRLALELARATQSAFPDGTFFVSLAPLREYQQVLPAIAQALGLEESGHQPLLERLQTYLRQKHLLLVLDNFEHVLEAAPPLSDLLMHAPDLTLLVTSRETLHLYGEHEFEVLPLTLPNASSTMNLPSDAVTLFVERARTIRADFQLNDENRPAVEAICIHLDGLPLAIELAAARIKLLTPQTILTRLQSRLSFLTGGARNLPTRQQTLRNTLDWSYDLLSPAEQRCFRRLGVLVGQWTLAAATATALDPDDGTPDALDLLTSLVDKSLVRTVVDPDGEMRFMLLETVREYALDRLDASQERETTQQRHAHFYTELAKSAEPHLYSQEQSTWLRRLDRDAPNLWAAMHRLLSQRALRDSLQFGSSLIVFLQLRSSLSEGRNWLEEILALNNNDERDDQLDVWHARVLYGAGVLAYMRNDVALARHRFTDSRKRATAISDTRIQALSAGMLALLELHEGNYEQASVYAEAGSLVIKGTTDRWCRGMLHSITGKIDCKRCRFAIAQVHYHVALVLMREMGDLRNQADVMAHMGAMLRLQGKLRTASFLYTRSLSLLQTVEDHWSQAACLNGIADILRVQGNYDEARERFSAALALATALDNKQERSAALTGLGQLALNQGEIRQAAHYLKESMRLSREIAHTPGIVLLLLGLGDLERVQGNISVAVSYYEKCLDLTRTLGDQLTMAGVLLGLGDIARMQRDYPRACAQLKQSLHLSWEIGDQPGLLAALELFAWLCNQVHLPEQAAQFLGAAEHLRDDLQISLAPFVAVEHERTLTELCEMLGSTVLEQSRVYGKTIALNLVVSMVARIHIGEQEVPVPQPEPRVAYPAGLTTREVDVLRLVAAGLTDVQIAAQLVVSPRTVNTHLRSIYAKLGVSTRSAATRFAFEHGLT